jgi:hypothetical protein
MFDLTIVMRRRSSSGNSTLSQPSSLSLSPVGWTVRPTMSPPSVSSSPTPSTASSTDSSFTLRQTTSSAATPKRRALSPPPSRFTTTAPATHQACAFPSWPIRDSLTPPPITSSPTTSYFSPVESCPSSRISDSDLEELEFQPIAVAESDSTVAAISWSAIGTDAVPQVGQRTRRLPPPPAQYRRSNSNRRSPTRKSGSKKLGAIAE